MFGTQAQSVQAQSVQLRCCNAVQRAHPFHAGQQPRPPQRPAGPQHAKHSSTETCDQRYWVQQFFSLPRCMGQAGKQMCLQDDRLAAATAPHAMPALAEATHLQASHAFTGLGLGNKHVIMFKTEFTQADVTIHSLQMFA